MGGFCSRATAVGPTHANATGGAIPSGHAQLGSGLLFKEKDNMNTQLNIVFHIKEGNLDSVRDCINAGISVNHIAMWGNTPLIVACQYNRVEIADYLLQFTTIDIHIENEKNATALVYACVEGMATIVESLLQKGAVFDTPSCKIYSALLDKTIECSPISASIVHGHDTIVQLLLQYGLSLNYVFSWSVLKPFQSSSVREVKGINLLLFACFCGQITIVNDLIAAGIDIEYKDESNSSFIHYACRSIHHTDELLQSLISPYTITKDILNQSDFHGKSSISSTHTHLPNWTHSAMSLGSSGNNFDSLFQYQNWGKGRA